MKKRYDGILIASDWDGTLNVHGVINERDIRAIRDFQEGGGLFTICSGRSLEFMREFFDIICPNTYAISLNGAVIKHLETSEVLYENVLDKRVSEMIDIVCVKEMLFNKIYVFIKGKDHASTYTPEEYKENRDFIISCEIYKVVLVAENVENTLKAKTLLENGGYDGYIFVRSWEVSLEILKEENGKGYALNRVKEKEGCHTTIAVGDYENDIQMLQMADIGYAVGNASQATKSAADIITVPAEEGAIATIIESL